MSATVAHGKMPYYYVPGPSRHPLMASIGLFFVILGAGQWINGHGWGAYALYFGLLWWLFVLKQWFGDAIGESQQGLYSDRVDVSYRWSMAWFIFSEVMFFAAFFGALYWIRNHSVPNLGSIDNALLWPDFKAVWPSVAPGTTASPAGIVDSFTTMHALGSAPAEAWKSSWFAGVWQSLAASLPTVNTALLLTSGVTLTIAHHALLNNQRSKTIRYMWITVLLGIVFLMCQGYEYYHAYHELNLKLSSGVYGSTFFMLTGFHGLHVFVGMLMLLFITLRLQRGHFTPQRHFGFEGAAWYWHFVDVVWLLLYLVVYWM